SGVSPGSFMDTTTVTATFFSTSRMAFIDGRVSSDSAFTGDLTRTESFVEILHTTVVTSTVGKTISAAIITGSSMDTATTMVDYPRTSTMVSTGGAVSSDNVSTIDPTRVGSSVESTHTVVTSTIDMPIFSGGIYATDPTRTEFVETAHSIVTSMESLLITSTISSTDGVVSTDNTSATNLTRAELSLDSTNTVMTSTMSISKFSEGVSTTDSIPTSSVATESFTDVIATENFPRTSIIASTDGGISSDSTSATDPTRTESSLDTADTVVTSTMSIPKFSECVNTTDSLLTTSSAGSFMDVTDTATFPRTSMNAFYGQSFTVGYSPTFSEGVSATDRIFSATSTMVMLSTSISTTCGTSSFDSSSASELASTKPSLGHHRHKDDINNRRSSISLEASAQQMDY
ncbi:hypothetical protein BGX34_007115, partial [Mortierella sp. NVP85]